MADFIMLMHRLPDGVAEGDWDIYLERLGGLGVLRGGSVIGDGASFSKAGRPASVTGHINGFVRVAAADLTAARNLLDGNPVYEAGGTVEIRKLPFSD